MTNIYFVPTCVKFRTHRGNVRRFAHFFLANFRRRGSQNRKILKFYRKSVWRTESYTYLRQRWIVSFFNFCKPKTMLIADKKQKARVCMTNLGLLKRRLAAPPKILGISSDKYVFYDFWVEFWRRYYILLFRKSNFSNIRVNTSNRRFFSVQNSEYYD